MEIQEIKLEELKPYKGNPRKNDEAISYVAESIKQFGFKVPIIIDKKNNIICGHTRYKAAKELKMNIVPCIVSNDLSEEQIQAFRLVDNKVSEKSEWDFDLLNEELENILDIDMSIFDFDIGQSEKEIEESSEMIGMNSFNYQEQYGVIVICKNEVEQEQIYNELQEKGYRCKVVAT